MARRKPVNKIREAAKFHARHELTFNQIATILDVSERTIRSWQITQEWQEEKEKIERARMEERASERVNWQSGNRQQYSENLERLKKALEANVHLKLKNNLKIEKMLDSIIENIGNDLDSCKALTSAGYDKIIRANSQNFSSICQAMNYLMAIEDIAKFINKDF